MRAQLEALRNKQAQDSRPDSEPEPLRRGPGANYVLDDSEDGYVEEIYDEEDDIIEFDPPAGKDEL